MGLTWLWYLVASLILKHRNMRKPGCVQHHNSISESKYLCCHLKEQCICS